MGTRDRKAFSRQARPPDVPSYGRPIAFRLVYRHRDNETKVMSGFVSGRFPVRKRRGSRPRLMYRAGERVEVRPGWSRRRRKADCIGLKNMQKTNDNNV